MGSAIAASCLSAGFDVVLFDVNAAVRERGAAALAERQQTARRWGALTLAGELADLAAADIVIDAVFEDMRVKVDFLTAVEAVVDEGAVLASNTSYLDLEQIAASLQRPGRMAGLHFFAPADRNALVEVVRTSTVEDGALATLAGVVKRLGKTGISARVGEGFVANRVYADYRGQAEILLEDGASPRQIDDAMIELGLAMGPFAVGDMSGLDIAWARRKRLAETKDPEQRYVAIPDALCEAGRLGRKTGAGWYDYAEGATRGTDSDAVAALIDACRAAKGITAREIGGDEIRQRILCAMLAAAAEVVGSGVAQRASDVDVALTEGFAFPRWLGGPVRHCAAQPEEWVIEGLAAVHASDPIGYAALTRAASGEMPTSVAEILESVR